MLRFRFAGGPVGVLGVRGVRAVPADGVVRPGVRTPRGTSYHPFKEFERAGQIESSLQIDLHKIAQIISS